MLQARIDQLMASAAVEQAQRDFDDTLANLCRELKERRVLRSDVKIDQTPRQWYEQLSACPRLLRFQDASLMLREIPVLIELNIPQAWVSGHLPASAKSIVWDYLSSLFESARTLERPRQEQDEARDQADAPPAPNRETRDVEEYLSQSLDELHLPPLLSQSMRELLPIAASITPENLTNPETRNEAIGKMCEQLFKRVSANPGDTSFASELLPGLFPR